MIVKEGSLVMQNVISVEKVITHDDWYTPVLGLRRYLVNEDIYYTSPVVFKSESIDGREKYGKYTYYIGVNSQVEIPDDLDFKQEEFSTIGPAIYVRCSEKEELKKAYDLLNTYAEMRDWELEPSFYHVTFDLFDDVIIDIYAKVKAGEDVEWS